MLMPARAVRSYFRAALTSRAGLFVRAFADISSAVALFATPTGSQQLLKAFIILFG
jgi:hypothetical protein